MNIIDFILEVLQILVGSMLGGGLAALFPVAMGLPVIATLVLVTLAIFVLLIWVEIEGRL